ncbi:MAG: TonB family protein [Bacteroidota bacterium]
MKHLYRICSPLLVSLLFIQALQAQNTYPENATVEILKKLDDNKYSIRALTADSVPLYQGTFSSLEPRIREGVFTFFYPSGNVFATGRYRKNFPAGPWTFYDTLLQVQHTIDYDDAMVFFKDTLAIIPFDSLNAKKIKKKELDFIDKEGSFCTIDEVPVFRKDYSRKAFHAFCDSLMIVPAYNQVMDIPKFVTVDFIIDYQGKLRHPKITRSGGPDLNLEILRILAHSPAWEPAVLNDIPVSSRMEFTFDFVTNFQGYSDEMYFIVEDMPLFNGGNPAVEFRDYIGANLHYPPDAAAKNISGRVIVQFAVYPDGSVQEVAVVRSVDPSLDEEAVRVVSSSPLWTPGRQRGRNVAVLFTFPINFVLQGPEPEKKAGNPALNNW